tara:strand:+ start:139 stop:282 length:144 start_codon:yes stop_codon:yes gene_type:complete
MVDEIERMEFKMNRNMYLNPTTGKVSIRPVVKGTYRIYNEVGRAIAT